MTTLLDPTNERRVQTMERVGRPESLRGLVVGLLDISKPRGDVFLDRL
ncbi:MAG: UGSC family (seleno)protein, partial [Ilumatobacteraceae bacterium]